MKNLRDYYSNEWHKFDSLRADIKDENISGPLLLELKSYHLQKIKLLIIGQQTKYWATYSSNLSDLLDVYSGFNLGKGYVNSPFWNITRKIESLIGIDKYSCAWTNLNRFDYKGAEPTGAILERIKEFDYLVKEEISILKPDICLFYTHNKYDYRLKNLFNNLQFAKIENLPSDQFSKLSHSELPEYTYRTPHPNSIRLRKWESEFLNVMKEILPRA
jgi:hypothetical protein